MEARNMLVWEFNNRILGARDRDLTEWRRTRWLATVILNPHLKKGTRLRPSDLLPLPDDVPLPKMSKERIKADVERKMKVHLKQRQN
jgi:hypothetical protein